MKNLLFIAIAAICFCSCTKTYECKCVDSRVVNKQDELFSISSTKKSDAKRRCEEYQETLYVNGYFYSCSID
jgi:hypothetical protein